VVAFPVLKTTGLRLEVERQPGCCAGLYRWVIEPDLDTNG